MWAAGRSTLRAGRWALRVGMVGVVFEMAEKNETCLKGMSYAVQ